MTEPIVLPDFDSFGDQAIKGLENPEDATAATQALLKEDRNSGEPAIREPAENSLTLERGICREGVWYRDAEVRELTGADEEAIAAAGNNSYKIFEALLLRGVRTVGNEFMNRQLAGELLIGDREYLVMAIRRATFGDELDFTELPCPHCDELVDLTVPLGAIPFTRLDDHEQTEFEVPLRRGETAVVRLPNGEDQAAVLSLKGDNLARQDSEILSRCVLRIRHADGTETKRPPATTLGMSARKKILAFLTETQPGPRYNDFSFTHDTCGKEVPLPISLAVLFRGM
ncbi:T4 family baseplate hub assembly chaperone [Streptomyces drozdowiczii]